MTANDKSKQLDPGIAEYVLRTVRAEKKSIITGLIVRVVILALVLSYMSYMYVKISYVNADTIVATARDKLSQQLPSLTMQLASRLKDSAPDVMQTLEERSIEAIPELGAHIEGLLKERIRGELGPLLEQCQPVSVRVGHGPRSRSRSRPGRASRRCPGRAPAVPARSRPAAAAPPVRAVPRSWS